MYFVPLRSGVKERTDLEGTHVADARRGRRLRDVLSLRAQGSGARLFGGLQQLRPWFRRRDRRCNREEWACIVE